jgi:hypothetical protein
MPTFLVLEGDYLTENIHFEMRYESCYSKNNLDENPPANRHVWQTHWNMLDSTSVVTGEIINMPAKAEITYKKDLVFKTRYYHFVDTTSSIFYDFDITLPEVVRNKDYILVYTSDGEAVYGDEYYLNNAGTIMTIVNTILKLERGSVIELYIYTDAMIKFDGTSQSNVTIITPSNVGNIKEI